MPWDEPEEGPSDDRPHEERRASGPPDPLHRTWFHPSELHGLLAGDGRVAFSHSTVHRRSRAVTAGVVAAGATALAALVAFVPVGTGAHTPASRLFAGVTLSTESTQSLSALASTAAANVVAILAGEADDLRRVGSGVPIGGGEVVTCADLLDGASTVQVATANGRTLEASLVARDPATDLALMRVKGSLAAARLGSSDDIHQGDRVLVSAAGPLSHATSGLQETFVIGMNRMASTTAPVALVGLIETDGRPTRGQEGGALLDRSGAVVGVVTSAREESGYALPIEVVRNVADQLRATGTVRRGWLGIGVDDGEGGVRVRHVEAGSPAARAGVAEGDLVVMAGDTHVHTVGDLMAALQRRRPGDPFRLRLVRGSMRIKTEARLDAADTTAFVLAGHVTG